jgi:Holliday junction resolvasome RuvABC endonuclease subunit
MILALDQSLTATGYVVANWGKIISHGVIQTKSEKKKRNIGAMDDACRRTTYIIENIVNEIRQHNVRAIVCEEYAGFSQSKSAADALATSRTIVCAISHILNIPMFFIPVDDVKFEITNNRSANKEDMIKAASRLFPEVLNNYVSSRTKNGWELKTEHLADAIGVYLCGRRLQSIKLLEQVMA